jgi:two-component system response regulator CpxR
MENLLIPPVVLIVENDASRAVVVTRALTQAGMPTEWAATGAEAMALATDLPIDLALIDLDLPDTSGICLVAEFRRRVRCGIIMTSAQASEAERVIALEMGADDFVTDHMPLRELVARLRALHRRARISGAHAVQEQGRVPIGAVQVDLVRRSATRQDGEPVPLTAAEFAMVESLASARGQIVSRERLSEAVLRRPWHADDRSVDQLIFGLRRKCGDGTSGHRQIQSVRGGGYMLVAAPV